MYQLLLLKENVEEDSLKTKKENKLKKKSKTTFEERKNMAGSHKHKEEKSRVQLVV